jgi:hypothetical protein
VGDVPHLQQPAGRVRWTLNRVVARGGSVERSVNAQRHIRLRVSRSPGQRGQSSHKNRSLHPLHPHHKSPELKNETQPHFCIMDAKESLLLIPARIFLRSIEASNRAAGKA